MNAEQLIKTYEHLQSARRPWEQHWQDIKDLVRCDTTDFTNTPYPGNRRWNLVYDATAADAAEELASGLHSYLTNPVERWFELNIAGMDTQNIDDEALLWLELVSDLVYSYYCDERSNLNPSLHEGYLDISSFGTCTVNQEFDIKDGMLVFQCFPLADCWFLENNKGRVDTIFRRVYWTKKQIMQEFTKPGDVVPKKVAEEKDEMKQFHVVHAVFPRSDRDATKMTARNKAFASFWFCVDTRDVMRESGYDSCPHHVSRWLKLAKETYGRGPAMKCLPDIKILNTMDKTIVKAGQKIVDPPLMVPNDGFMLPINTSPGSLMFKEPGAEKIEVLATGGQLQIGLELTNQKRESIRRAFHSEWLKMEKENKEMTAYEVQDRRNEKLRLIAPMLARQQTELLSPMVLRSIQLLMTNRRLPTPPQSIQGQMLKVGYVSQAARAQLGVKGLAMTQYLQNLIPLAQVDQTVMDSIDIDKFAQQMALISGVSRIILRSPQMIAQIRQQRQKTQAAQQMAQTLEPASKAMKNISDAQKNGLNLSSLGAGL